MKRAFIIAASVFLSCSIPAQVKPGYEISISIKELQDSTLYLAYHFGDKQYLKDTLKLDHSGSGIFNGAASLPKGIYMVVLPGRRYFEVLIPDDQHFSLSCSYPDYIHTLKFTGSTENSAFIEYQKNWSAMQEYSAKLVKRSQESRQNQDSAARITHLYNAHEASMKAYLNRVTEENRGNLLALVVKAIIPVEVPGFEVPLTVSNPDSVRRMRTYLYNKDHFFDNIDLSDERILRTPILQAKLRIFFTNVVIQLADSINNEIDRLIAMCSANPKVFQFVSVFLFNHFRESEIMGHDAVVVKLADDIYLSGKADWTTGEWRENLRKEVDRIRPNLIGVKAHDLVMDSFTGVFVSLHDIIKDFTIIYFWEPDCGHCKEATPKLKEYYDRAKNQGVEVFAVCTQPDRSKWEKYIQDYKLTWINGWDPQRRTNYDYYYNVTATPAIFILDRNKTIIAKKLPVESIESFIDSYRKYVMK
jgi:thiol-disulfide isomerase/thioredoxin